jgi:adenine-specific DNA-methyltransferase
VIENKPELLVEEARAPGVVYTKPWVVEAMLDLSGYTADRDLARLVIVEPSAGDGAFLRGIVKRLCASCKVHKRSIDDAQSALKAFEIDPIAASRARELIESELLREGVTVPKAQRLSEAWVVVGDFLEASLGFPFADFVIGNPPYIRLEEVSPGKMAFYRSSFPTMKGRADIYIAFYEAALMQLKPGGICSFICADRWFLNEYGAELRRHVSNNFSVRFIVEAHDVQAFDDTVSAYPAITVIANGAQSKAIVAKALPGIESVPTADVVKSLRAAATTSFLESAEFKNWFKDAEPWACSSPKSLAILKDLESRFEPLESVHTGTKVGIGIATGADKIYVVKTQPDIESDRLLPMAMAFDLEGPETNWSGHYLINPWDQDGLVDLEHFPRLKKYLSPSRGHLEGRHTAKGRPTSWHRTIDRVNFSLIKREKLYIADIKDRLLPTLDKGKTYPHHNVYWITSDRWDLRVLGAILMSEVGEFFIRCYGVKMRGGYFRFQAQYLRRIRVPDPESISPKQASLLIAAFENRDQKLATEVTLKLYGIKSIPTPS